MSESAGEKSFAPTEKRRRDAALKGDVLRSRELSTAVVMLFGAGWLALAGPWLLRDLIGLLRASLVFDRDAVMRFEVGPLFDSMLFAVAGPLATLAVPALIAAMGLTGFLFGIIQPSRDMLVRKAAPPGAAGRVFGIVSTGFNIGGIVGPLLFGWLMDQGAPRAIFGAAVAFMAVTAVLAVLEERRSRPKTPTTCGA